MYAVPEPHHPPSSTLRFATALDAARRFERSVACGHGLIQATDRGEVYQQVALDGPFTADHATGWALGFHANHRGCGSSLVLLSAGHDPVAELDRYAVACAEFETTRSWLAAQGIWLHDWFITDGSVLRSLAFTSAAEVAWPNEPADLIDERMRRNDPGLID